ncbi:MAG: dynamin family protein [Oscillochloridaceae bacterium umkhey_bin13]
MTDAQLHFRYNETRDRLVGYLERLRLYAQRNGLEAASIAEIDRVLERSRTSTFTLAVVGEFNRGKSTFINALLGRPILPADALPATATVNRVRYGPRALARVVYKADDDEPERIEPVEVERLREYVTKLDDDGELASQIKHAEVFFPLTFLEQIEIIDTPGLNDEISMTDVTYGILPEVDAAIMLVVPQSPFGQTEEEFLNHLLSQDVGRVMFVINRIDQVRRVADRERAIAGIKERIGAATQRRAEMIFEGDPAALQRYQQRIGSIQVFGLSAREALEARINNDAARLEASGFPVFEHALRDFLERGRGAARLQIIANRLLVSGQQVAQSMLLRLNALQLSQEQFATAYEQSRSQLDELSQRLAQEYAQIDATAERMRRVAQSQLDGLGDQMKRVAAQVIEEAPMSEADLEPAALRIYSRNLRQQLHTALQDAARDLADRLQHVLEVEVALKRERLEALANELGRELSSVTQQFMVGDLAVGTESSMGGLIANRNVMMGAGAMMGLMTLFTPAAPVALLVAMVGAFGGNWISRTVGTPSQIARFKQELLAEVEASIAKQLAQQAPTMRGQFDAHVTKTFADLRQQAEVELGGPVEQLRRTVDELRLERERGLVQAEHMRSEAAIQQQEVEHILAEAQAVLAALDAGT